MELGLSDEYEAYRAEVRDFVRQNWKPTTDAAAIKAFRLAAIDKGYLYRNVPKRFGGSEQPADVLKAKVIREEFTSVRAPLEVGGISTDMLVPTLLEKGEEWQKELFVPKTIAGEYLWAQGYSEPGSGSDLASLRTRAELVGDEWVINGQKIWTTRAHLADYMFLLVRTEPDAPTKHEGISYLLLDLKQPGVEIRPLKQMTGGTGFSEVFFTNARTPGNWIVGKRGEGWLVSKSTLKHERNMMGGADKYTTMFSKLVHMARKVQRNGRPAIEDPDMRQRLARVEGYILSHQYSSARQLTKTIYQKEPGIVGMMNKLVTTNIGHDIARIAQDLMGDDGLLMPGFAGSRGNEKWVEHFMGSLGVAIAGGTSNIQRNIIAERGLGLPREEER
ncbi:MAG: acyl-CoA dehydrogenase family protein [Rhodocyclaceae bacterium]|jgi:alkylation response protein AidB-like acyl-CoA dehydrogenase|nr:acyl-CoA dehydrogenase family protein [Rhodocyclaceae bacterium]